MKIAACCMTKNEERDIAEWVLYHYWIGFDTIVVFENSSEDRTREKLDELAKLIDVRIFDWPYEYNPGHQRAFAKCASDFRDEFDWIGLFDHDEFLVPIAHGSPKEYLQSMDAFASICINWALFGSSGHVDFPDGLVTESFVHRPRLSFPTNRFAKSIVRPKEMVGCSSAHYMNMKSGVPTVDAKGNPIDWLKPGKVKAPVGLEDTIRFHHYFVRSRAHWAKRMAIPFMAQYRAEQRFEDYDKNDVYDPIIPEKYGSVLENVKNAVRRD